MSARVDANSRAHSVMRSLHKISWTQRFFPILRQCIQKLLRIIQASDARTSDDGIRMFNPRFFQDLQRGYQGSLHDAAHAACLIGCDILTKSGIHGFYERFCIRYGLLHPFFRKWILNGYLFCGLNIDLSHHSFTLEIINEESLPPNPKAFVRICSIRGFSTCSVTGRIPCSIGVLQLRF